MADNQDVVVIKTPSGTPPSGSSLSDGQLEQAERLGQALERLSRLESELADTRIQLQSGEADRAEMARLQSRVTQLEALLAEVEEEIEAETESDVTVITPPPPAPPPVEETPEPPKKKKGFFEKMCFGESD